MSIKSQASPPSGEHIEWFNFRKYNTIFTQGSLCKLVKNRTFQNHHKQGHLGSAGYRNWQLCTYSKSLVLPTTAVRSNNMPVCKNKWKTIPCLTCLGKCWSKAERGLRWWLKVREFNFCHCQDKYYKWPSIYLSKTLFNI